jgi:hypothetical protein
VKEVKKRKKERSSSNNNNRKSQNHQEEEIIFDKIIVESTLTYSLSHVILRNYEFILR